MSPRPVAAPHPTATEEHLPAVDLEDRQHIWWTLIAAVWALGGAISLAVWRNFTVDDAFIGWRHGKNLVEHGRYAFNPTGDRLEAATSPLFGLAAAVPELVGIDVVLFFKLVSVAALVGFVLVARTVGATDRRTGAVFLLAAVAGPIQAVHLWSGLETGVFLLLCTMVGLSAVGRLELTPATAGVLGAVLVLTRQEGVLFVLPMIWLAFVNVPDDSASIGRRLAKAAPVWAPPLGVLLGLTTFRWWYFGSPLPNTLTTKSGQELGLGEIADRMVDNAGSFIPSLIALVVVGAFVASTDRRRFVTLVSVVLVPGLALYLSSALLMNYAVRFSYQLVWPLVLVAVAIVAVAPLTRLLIAGVASALLLGSVQPGELKGLADYYPRATSAMLPLGEALASAEDGPGTLVMGDAGQVPYISEWTLLDTFFLGTPASLGEEGIIDHIADGERTVLALYGTGPDPDAEPPAPYSDAARSADYTYVASVQWRSWYWYHVWISPDLADDGDLIDALNHAADTSIEHNTDRTLIESVVPWFWHT